MRDWPGPMPSSSSRFLPAEGIHTWKLAAGAPPANLLRDERDRIHEALLEHGAVHFPAAGVGSTEEFARIRDVLIPATTPYVEAATPRRALGDQVFTSTEFPASEEIALHNENSYASSWPGELLFCCLQPAETGGATPLGDVRRVLRRLPEELVSEFDERGWMLIRNYGTGFGLPWQQAFGTEVESEVDDYCRAADVCTEWLPDGRLRTRQERKALARHPETGERVWFNHICFWHSSRMPAATREMLVEELGENGLPYESRFGDGGVIPAETVAEIAAAYEAEKRSVPWGRGDLILVDNMLVAHGRERFAGERRVLVSMGNPRTREECGAA
jgi:alpha-ketoglutarate-dependent taurine dioxygenase